MKKTVIVLLYGLLFCTFSMAQLRLGNFTQRGTATQEIESGELVAAHPSIPIGTQVRVTNTENGKQIIATINGRIPPSSERIVNLSKGAAAGLDMPFQGTAPVLLEVLDSSRRRPVTPEVPPPPPPVELAAIDPVAEPGPEPVSEPEPELIAEEPAVEEPAAEPIAEEPAAEPSSGTLAGATAGNITINITYSANSPGEALPEPKADTEPVLPPLQYPPMSYPAPSPYPVYPSPYPAYPPPYPYQAPQAPAPAAASAGGGNQQQQQQQGAGASPTIVVAPVIVPSSQGPATAGESGAAPVQMSPSVPSVSTPQPVYPAQPPQPVPQYAAPQQYPPPQQYPAPQQYPPPQQPPQQAAPQQAPQYAAPQYPAPQYAAPQYAAPQYPAPQYAAPQYAAPQYAAPQYAPAAIMPRPPAAGDTGIYRVQLGAFREAINAQQLITALQQNGFTPAYENHDNYYRVVLSGVSAASLQDVARRLGGMGIREMWIRREQ